jgi:hypothetical protein
MNTRTLASRFVVVVTGISVTASALAQVSPQATYPATPAVTGAYDPAPTAATPAAAPTVTDPAAQTPAYSPPVAQATYPAPAGDTQAPPAQTPPYTPPVAQTPAYPAPDSQTPAAQPPAYQPPAEPAPGQTPAYQPPAQPAPTQTPAYQTPAYPAPAPGIPAPAQMPAGTSYGTTPYGAQPNGAMPNGMMQPMGQMPAPSHVRNAFAATLGAILQNAASAGTLGLSQLITGSITAWFNRKANRLAGQPYGVPTTPGYAPAYPTADPYGQVPGQTAYPTQQTYGTQPAYPATAQQPYGTQSPTQPYGAQTTSPYPGQQTYSTQSAYPTQPGQTTTQPYGTTQSYSTTPYAAATTSPYGTSPYGATSYYDPQTGQATQPISYGTATGTGTPDLYAGIAYEVHAVQPAGSVPVNPSTYEFHTGDRFLVHYRPSMPGRMEVYNVNPLGQTTLIDSVNMAAGQLSTLGPYEFAANKGDESLRIVLSPCSTPQLLTASRDIINVSNTMQPSAQSGYGSQLGSCSALTTRGVDKGGVRTRDIRNVALDGGTSFALDPVSRQELSSGTLAPREVTIVFHHR